MLDADPFWGSDAAREIEGRAAKLEVGILALIQQRGALVDVGVVEGDVGGEGVGRTGCGGLQDGGGRRAAVVGLRKGMGGDRGGGGEGEGKGEVDGEMKDGVCRIEQIVFGCWSALVADHAARAVDSPS